MNIISFIGSFSFIFLCLVFIVYQVMFFRLFNQIKRENPKFLDSKIKKYSFLDIRSQFANVILWGRYKEVKNEKLKLALNKLRALMIIGLISTLIVSFLFILTIIITHH